MTFVLIGCLVALIALIGVTLWTLPKLGDERANFIKMKAQSYAFAVVIGLLLIEVAESIYITVATERTYDGIQPFTFLIAISVIYLASLLFLKKKYGD